MPWQPLGLCLDNRWAYALTTVGRMPWQPLGLCLDNRWAYALTTVGRMPRQPLGVCLDNRWAYASTTFGRMPWQPLGVCLDNLWAYASTTVGRMPNNLCRHDVRCLQFVCLSDNPYNSFVSAHCSIEEVRVWWHIDGEKRDAEVLFLFVLNFLLYPLAASVVLNGTHLLLLLLWT